MKNKIITILALISILLLTISVFKGIKIGNFRIPSISQLKEKNQDLNTKIQEARVLTTVDFPDSIQTLEETYEKLTLDKQKFEEISSLSETNDDKIYETKQYDIGYLWKIVGKYSNLYNLTIAMDVKNSGKTNLYNLYFTVAGQYVNISQFISDIENNSDLNFRIYNFKISGEGEIISATFTVKNINIDPATIKSSTTTKSN